MSKFLTAWKNEKTGEIHSPKLRLVYPTFFEAKINRTLPEGPANKPKFSCLGLIPKNADISMMIEDVKRAGLEKMGKDWSTLVIDSKRPILATKNFLKLAEFADEFPFVLKASANAEYPPFIFGPDAKRVTDHSQAYNGRWAVIAGGAWGYTTGSKGIGWNLGRVQLLDHDEVIAGGRVETAEGFEAVGIEAAQNVTGGEQPKSADSLWA